MTEARARSVRSAMVTPALRPDARMPARCSSPERGTMVRLISDTQPFSLRVDEARRAGLDFAGGAAHRIDRRHALAGPLRAARQQTETDPVIERRRERDRGDHALI